ncbi:MAG: class I SAM-dependent methyltransferase [Clostridia bacterium]|nr:class I SAM-dependent methyltransferase [Clostridia bacterium]
MRILRGKKIIEITSLDEWAQYGRVVVDVGTGDGRFVYKLAKADQDALFIGVDSAAQNMMEYAAKVMKKPSKGGLSNVLYVVASAESLPEELTGMADKIHINLPWGSLLEGVVKCSDEIFDSIKKVVKPTGAELEICFTYSILYETGEMNRRELPELSLDYVKGALIPAYEKKDIEVEDISIITNEVLREYGTQWAKRLGFGRARDVYRVKAFIKNGSGN